MVLDCCEAIIGSLEAKAAEAAAIEGTVAGRVATFVGFPARVRAAVALEHPQLGKFAFGAGVLGQVLAGVLVGVIVAAVIGGVGALWKALF